MTDQVNTCYSSVTDKTPYEIISGRGPKPPPLFGRPSQVIEDGEADQLEHSYSAAYDDPDDDRNIEITVSIDAH